MGKKKHGRHGDRHAGGGFPLAGLVAAAAAQANSPAGRQMIAGVLRKAADALDRRGAQPGAAPRAPEAPDAAANDAPPFPPKPPHPPQGEMPPEVARVIGSVTAGLEKWAAKMGAPRG